MGLTASAGRLHVRVLDFEAGPHHAVFDEVDLAASQVRRALLVHVLLDPAGLDDVVPLGHLVLPAEVVGHPGAAATHDPDAEAPLGLPLFQPKVHHLLCRRLAQRDHSGPPAQFLPGIPAPLIIPEAFSPSPCPTGMPLTSSPLPLTLPSPPRGERMKVRGATESRRR